MTAAVKGKGVKPAGSWQSAGLSYLRPGDNSTPPDWFRGWVERPDGSYEMWEYGVRVERPEAQR